MLRLANYSWYWPLIYVQIVLLSLLTLYILLKCRMYVCVCFSLKNNANFLFFAKGMGYSRVKSSDQSIGTHDISCSLMPSKRIFCKNYQFSQAVTCVLKLQDKIQNPLSFLGIKIACENAEHSHYNYYFLRKAFFYAL